MAESFTNALGRAIGIVSTSNSGSIGVTTNLITGISTVGLSVGDLIDNSNYIGGTEILNFGSSANQVVANRNSTNTASTSAQTINFLTTTTIYTSPTGIKSILIGGTLSNNTSNQVNATVQVGSGNTYYNLLYKIPVPAGSSVVISDAGKTLLQANDIIRVASSENNSIDVSLSILQGVS